MLKIHHTGFSQELSCGRTFDVKNTLFPDRPGYCEADPGHYRPRIGGCIYRELLPLHHPGGSPAVHASVRAVYPPGAGEYAGH